MDVEDTQENISGTDTLSSFSIFEYTNPWVSLILGWGHLELSVRRELILKALHSFLAEIIQPLFMFNVAKSAFISYYLRKSMNAWLVIAAATAWYFELPMKGNSFNVYVAYVMVMVLTLGNRFLTFTGLFILICLLESMTTVLNLFFLISLINVYHDIIAEMQDNNDMDRLSYFVLGMANIYFVHYYLSVCSITTFVWYVDVIYVLSMLSYIYFYGCGSVVIRLHIGFILYFQTIMLIILLPFGKILDLFKF